MPFRTTFILLLACLRLPALQASDTLVFKDDATGYIGRHLEILVTDKGALSPEHARQHHGFVASASEVPNLGLSDKDHWVRFTVTNGGSLEDQILSIGHPDIDFLEVYEAKGSDAMEIIGRSGLRVPANERKHSTAEYSFSLSTPPGGTKTIYMLIRSDKQLQLPVFISSPAGYLQDRNSRNLLLGGYIGIMVVMALYNLFIYLSMQDKSYLLYVLYILSVTLTQLAFAGVAPFHIWSGSVWFAPKATVLLTISTAVLASEFLIVFINTKAYAPGWHRPIRLFYVALGACALLEISELPLLAYKSTQVVSGAFATFLIALVFRVWRRNSRQAGYFLVAWSMFLVGTVLFVMKDMGFLPYNSLTLYMMPLGSAIEGVMLSFALADRINILRREKERSQADSLRMAQENERLIREQNVVLEAKVKQRTAALQESNDTLRRTQAQLVSSEKMASLGQLTAGIAHEINNPVNFITSNIKPLRRNISEVVEAIRSYRAIDPDAAGHALLQVRAAEERMGLDETIQELDDIIGSISEGAQRTAEIVRGLRNFSRLDEDDLKPADLNEGLRSTLTVLAPQYRDQVEFALELGDAPKVECFPGKVNQVFMNILTNAAQATLARPDGRPRKVRAATEATAEHVIIRIADTGIGMSEDVKSRIFDPFFTTKPVGEGTGLGLAIVYGIINEHGGSIEVDSQPGIGTEFRITLPIQRAKSSAQRA